PGVDELGEILSGQIGAERMRRGRRPYPPHRRADGPELQPAERERAEAEPHADDPVPAQRRALGRHPADRLPPGVIHGLGQRAVGGPAALPGHLRRRRDGPAEHTGGPAAGAAVAAGIADVVHARAEDLADRLEADATDRRELLGGERRPPGAAVPDLRHPGPRRRREPGARAVVGQHGPFRLLLNAAPTLPFPGGQATHAPGSQAGALLAWMRATAPPGEGRRPRSVFGVPLLVAPADGLQGPGRLLLGGVGPEPVLARAVTVPFRPVMPEAIPPAPFIVHATRLPDHGNDAPARPDLTHPAGAGAHPPAGIRRQEAPVDG